jgi:molecular chaperone DnaK (HSP70)
MADAAVMATFFHAWRKRQAEKQAAEWTDEQEEARVAVEELPDVLRDQVRRTVEKLIEGPDTEVEGALEELDQLLEPHPDLKERFFRLRVVDDAVKFLK